MEALNYPPHISLAIYDDIPLPLLFKAFDSGFSDLSKVMVRFESLGFFETPHALILWAVPNLPRQISSVHEEIHAQIGPIHSRPYYRPGSWVPHCSLATTISLERKPEALAIANQPIDPFDVLFDVADCLSFLPVEILRERKLP